MIIINEIVFKAIVYGILFGGVVAICYLLFRNLGG